MEIQHKNGRVLSEEDLHCAEELQEDSIVARVRESAVSAEDAVSIADFFKAFSDGTRLRILHALSINELCVGELCALTGASQSAVSNHLRVLYRERIVRSQRRGKHVYYSLDDWHINAIIAMAMEHYHMDCPAAREKGEE